MPEATLTKTFEFSSSHRYYRDEWTEKRNLAVFGACAYPNGHGHNYMLEVTVKGPIDPVTGMVINIVDIKEAVLAVLEEFDHRHLNLDTPYFKDKIPTTENFAVVLWEKVGKAMPKGARLHGLKLHEDEDLFIEYFGGK